jgi:hypothetical protein
VGIASGAGTDFENFHTGFEVFLDISDGCEKFHLSALGGKARVLVMGVVVFVQVVEGVHGVSFPQETKTASATDRNEENSVCSDRSRSSYLLNLKCLLFQMEA